jgi:hypothetical protein
VAFPAEVRTLTHIVTCFVWSKLNLGFLAFLYFVGLDIELLYLKTVRDIDAVHRQDDRLTFLQSDQVWVVRESLGDDFDSPGLFGTARRQGPDKKYSWQEQ